MNNESYKILFTISIFQHKVFIIKQIYLILLQIMCQFICNIKYCQYLRFIETILNFRLK